MNTITLMKQFISKQAQQLFIVREGDEPLFGFAEDGNFDENGKFDGKGEPALYADLEMSLILEEGYYWSHPVRVVEGVYLYDEEQERYIKVAN